MHRWTCLLLCCASLILLALATGRVRAAETEPKAWTVLIYMDADNDLETAGLSDFNEIETVGSDSNVNIVVQLDRSAQRDTGCGDWSGARRYYVTRDVSGEIGSQMLADLGPTNMGDPATLRSFLAYGAVEYPAERYALVLWDHGGGWRARSAGTGATAAKTAGKALCFDEGSGDCLYTKEWTGAIAAGDTTFACVGFDVCLGGMIEPLYELWRTGRAEAAAAAPPGVPLDGWPYRALLSDLQAQPQWSGSELAAGVVRRYSERYPGAAVSAYDLSQTGALGAALRDFNAELIRACDTQWPLYSSLRNGLQAYDVTQFRDLRAFVEGVRDGTTDPALRQSAAAAAVALEAFIPCYHCGSSYSRGRGLSVSFPTTGPESGYSGAAIEWAAVSLWPEFLAAFRHAPTAPSLVAVDPKEPAAATELMAAACGSTDANPADLVSYEYQWDLSTDGGMHWSACGGGASLPGASVRKGQWWRVQARARAGALCSPWVQSPPVTIGNRPPSPPTRVALSPEIARTNDDLMATAEGATDADDDGLRYLYQWRRSGDGGRTWSDWERGESRYAATATARGELYQCRAQATDAPAGQLPDPQELSDWVHSGIVAVVNTPPQAPSTVTVAPRQPQSGTELRAVAEGGADADGDALTYAYQWSCSEDGKCWTPWGGRSRMVSGLQTRAGQQWRVRCRASDGSTWSAWRISEPRAVINSRPSRPLTVCVSPVQPGPDDNLTATAEGSVDGDGDAFTYMYEWSRSVDGGRHWSAWAWRGATLPASRTAPGEAWKVRARASDGRADGLWRLSAPVSVETSPVRPGPAAITAAVARGGAGATICVSLSAPATVEVRLCNAAGRTVGMLPPRPLPGGTTALAWPRRGLHGTALPQGSYLLWLTARSADGSCSTRVVGVQ